MTTHKTTPKTTPKTTHKVFNDPIHGTVELHPLLVKIIDTPQFQRLRNIKQLGGVYFVYPGASHNRFEHSIGVAHLAGELVKALQTRQPEHDIDDRDVLCVQIAGLCHDLGHGPFSHMFETFIHKAHPESNWKHEKASSKMFDYLVDVNKLKPVMEQHGLVLPEDQTFIKELIAGPLDKDEAQGQAPNFVRVKFVRSIIQWPYTKWPYEGRREEKSFLYEIVANQRNGIDVDKFDYLARDAHHLGIKTNFDHLRFIKFARVCKVKQEDGQEQKQICTRDKEVNNLYELFHLRYTLHRKAYQHSVNNIIESMIIKAFMKADEHIQIEGSGGKMFTLSTAIGDLEAYIQLTDQVYQQILSSPAPEPTDSPAPEPTDPQTPKLTEAKDILKKIVDRKHPRCLGEIKLPEAMSNTLEKMKPEARDNLKRRWEKELATCQDDGLKPEDFEVHIVKFDYGAKDEDPIKKMRFYKKSDLDKKSDLEVACELPEDQRSVFHPTIFSEKRIRVYYENTDGTSVDKAFEHMEKCKKQWPDLQ